MTAIYCSKFWIAVKKKLIDSFALERSFYGKQNKSHLKRPKGLTDFSFVFDLLYC